VEEVSRREQQMAMIEGRITDVSTRYEEDQAQQTAAIGQLQQQMQMMVENQQTLMEKLGVGQQPSGNGNGATRPAVNNGAGAPIPTP